ncbi:MAG: helix-turn-helix domain-containing protein [Reyranellales bacterium]
MHFPQKIAFTRRLIFGIIAAGQSRVKCLGSQNRHPILDLVSQPMVGRLVELSTDAVPAAQRLDFWRASVLKRTYPQPADEARSYSARLRRIVLHDSELIEHAGDGIISRRAPGRSHFDDGDDIAFEFMRDCTQVTIDHNGERRLRKGDLVLIDYALPKQVMLSRHRACGIVLSRSRVNEALGQDARALAGRPFPRLGLAAVLRAQIGATLDKAPHMTNEARVVAVKAIVEMALAVLRIEGGGPIDDQQFGAGLYAAACTVIQRHCVDPNLSPVWIAQTLGCSRATLYRVFARADRTVAAAIWSARIERAWRMLTSPAGLGMLISEAAFQCGFVEMPTFTRMFKQRYGMTPSEARQLDVSAAVR